jgi:hypothetical protein
MTDIERLAGLPATFRQRTSYVADMADAHSHLHVAD